MKRVYLILTAMLLMVVGCTTTAKKAKQAQHTVDLDEIVASTSQFNAKIDRVIPLETTDNSMFGEVRKAIFENGRLFIQDMARSSLFVFSADGRHIGTLSKQGRGPGEYIKLKDFDVDGDFIYILSGDVKKIIQYNMENFDIVSETEIPETASKIRVSNNTVWLGDIFTYDWLYELAILENGEIKPLLEVREDFDNTLSETPVELKIQAFFSSDEYTLFNQRYTGDVYQLGANGVELLLDVSSRLPTSGNTRDRNTFNGFNYLYRQDDILFGTLWGIIDTYPPFFVMNLSNGKASLCDLNTIGLPAMGTLFAFGEQFATLVSPLTFSNIDFDPRLLEGAGKINESDNPLVVTFSLEEISTGASL